MRATFPRLGQSGGSVVEFAIVAPVLVSIVLYATFFWDALRTKLKTQEAANFYAWEFTSLPMSDYLQSGQAGHARLFSRAQGLIDADFRARYVSLDSSNPRSSPSFIASEKLAGGTGNVQVKEEAVPVTSAKTFRNLGLGSAGSEVASMAGKGIDDVLKLYDFDTQGMVTVSVSTEMQNIILPADFLNRHFGNSPLTPLNTITFTDKRALIIDDWAVQDGADSNLKQVGSVWGTRGNTGQIHPMAKQVERMAFLGLNNFVPGLDKFEGLVGGKLPDPLAVPVASLNYWRIHQPDTPQGADCDNTYDDHKHGCIDFKVEGRKMDRGVYRIHTIPMRTTSQLAGNASPPEYEVFEEGGPWYMGCPRPQSNNPTLGHAACHP